MHAKRRVVKKGRVIITRKGEFVLKLADRIFNELKPYCRRIKIAGSIRRKERNPVDADIVLIPKNKERIESILKEKGRIVRKGEKIITCRIQGVTIEIYYTQEDSWGASLLTYTGASGYNIGLRMYAKKRGFKLNQYGLFEKTRKIAGRTEKEIYNALGKNFKAPEKRQ